MGKKFRFNGDWMTGEEIRLILEGKRETGKTLRYVECMKNREVIHVNVLTDRECIEDLPIEFVTSEIYDFLPEGEFLIVKNW